MRRRATDSGAVADRRRGLAASLLALLLVLAGCSGASDELSVPPVRDGLEARPLAWWSRAAIDALLRFSAWRGAHGGYIVLLARDGVPVYGNAWGWKDIASRQPMALDTEVEIASMTKPLTAVAAMTLVEEGRLRLDDPVSDYLPGFADLRVASADTPGPDGVFPSRPAQSALTIRHLLDFTGGIGSDYIKGAPLVDYWDRRGIYEQESGTLAERVARLPQLPLLNEPGAAWHYGFALDVLAVVMEKITGQFIGDILRERIFTPLGMAHTRYLVEPGDAAALATIYTRDANGDLVPADVYQYRGWAPGGGGLVSTAGDYLRFALMLWNGGEYRGVRILQRGTVREMTRAHVPGGVLADQGIEGIGWGLGMAVVVDADASLPPDRDGDFWWSGFYGTTFFVSPSTGLAGVAMTQHQPGPHTRDPVEVFLVQGLALAGL